MSVLGALATGLMVVVVVVAAGSLIIAATIPIGNWLQKRRTSRSAEAAKQ